MTVYLALLNKSGQNITKPDLFRKNFLDVSSRHFKAKTNYKNNSFVNNVHITVIIFAIMFINHQANNVSQIPDGNKIK